MNSYPEIIRPLNCIAAGIGTLIGCVIAGINGYFWLFKALLSFSVVFLITGAGNTLNDYYDAETDKINHPDRPIPSGRIKQKNAMIFAVSLFISGIIISLFLNPLAFFIAVFAILLLVSYEKSLKNTGLGGNITISILVGLVFIFGGVSIGITDKTIKVILVLTFMSFLANLGREIIKDIEDVEGDTDRDTLPRIVGVKNAGLVASGILILAVIISPLPYIAGIFGKAYLAMIGFADAMFIYSLILLDKPKTASKIIKTGMIIALIGFLAGGII